MHQIINRSNVRLAIGLQIIHISVLILGIIYLGNFKSGSSFLNIGPGDKNNPINIFGFNIDTWEKWSLLIFFLIFSEMIQTFSGKIYNNWYKNIVSDPKSNEIGMDNHEAMYIINIWDITTWISKIFKWSVFIFTKQLQFMLPQFIAYLFISNKINHRYIISKTQNITNYNNIYP